MLTHEQNKNLLLGGSAFMFFFGLLFLLIGEAFLIYPLPADLNELTRLGLLQLLFLSGYGLFFLYAGSYIRDLVINYVAIYLRNNPQEIAALVASMEIEVGGKGFGPKFASGVKLKDDTIAVYNFFMPMIAGFTFIFAVPAIALFVWIMLNPPSIPIHPLAALVIFIVVFAIGRMVFGPTKREKKLKLGEYNSSDGAVKEVAKGKQKENKPKRH